MKKRKTDRIFDLAIIIAVGLFALICLLPFLNIASVAFSSNDAIISGRISIYAIGFQTKSFEAVLRNRNMWRSFRFTVILTVLY